MLLVSVPIPVITWTEPLVAPAGTVVVINVSETTVKAEGIPLKVTAVVLLRLLPRTLTLDPTMPEVAKVFTNGARPSEIW